MEVSVAAEPQVVKTSTVIPFLNLGVRFATFFNVVGVVQFIRMHQKLNGIG